MALYERLEYFHLYLATVNPTSGAIIQIFIIFLPICLWMISSQDETLLTQNVRQDQEIVK